MKRHCAPLRKIDHFVHSFPGGPADGAASGVDLQATLDSGQSFQWLKEPRGSTGWVGGQLFRVRQQGERLEFESPEPGGAERLAEYLQISFDTGPLKESFTRLDPFLRAAVAFSPGLRILKQDPWECLAGFILSSTKQIAHIRQIWQQVARRHGRACEWNGARYHEFPRAEVIARLSEQDLRACRMGFRARYLLAAARAVASGMIQLSLPCELSTCEARSYLMRIPGVGAKVADCVLLFAYQKYDAFPRDVWIDRVLGRVYFRGKRKVSQQRIGEFIRDYFGPHAGYAQQFLFHYVRMNPGSLECASTR